MRWLSRLQVTKEGFGRTEPLARLLLNRRQRLGIRNVRRTRSPPLRSAMVPRLFRGVRSFFHHPHETPALLGPPGALVLPLAAVARNARSLRMMSIRCCSLRVSPARLTHSLRSGLFRFASRRHLRAVALRRRPVPPFLRLRPLAAARGRPVAHGLAPRAQSQRRRLGNHGGESKSIGSPIHAVPASVRTVAPAQACTDGTEVAQLCHAEDSTIPDPR